MEVPARSSVANSSATETIERPVEPSAVCAPMSFAVREAVSNSFVRVPVACPIRAPSIVLGVLARRFHVPQRQRISPELTSNKCRTAASFR